MKKTFFLISLILFSWGCDEMLLDTTPENQPAENFDLIWQSFDRHYSFFELKNIDWDSTYAVYRPLVTPAISDEELLVVLGDMLLSLEDGHVNLYTPLGAVAYDFTAGFPLNAPVLAPNYLETRTDPNPVLFYGKIRGEDIGYLFIDNFSEQASLYKAIDAVLENLGDQSAFIVDVRSNGGGSDGNSDLIASRFADQKRLYERIKYRNGPEHDDFTDWIDRFIEPAGPQQFLKPVAVLTNRSTFSAAEAFVLAMRILPQVSVIGSRTGGGSGNPIYRELPNGWAYRLSNWVVATPEGKTYEQTGILPDIEVNITRQDSLAGRDAILETAIEHLKQQ